MKMVHLGIHKFTFASTVGALILIVGIFFGWYGFPYAFNKNLYQRITLSPGSEAMKRWMNIPFPLEFKVHFFNVTNPDEIHEGEQPKLQEVGPYVFDLYKTKVDVSYNESADTVVYYNKNRYEFNANKSYPNREDDKLVLLNVPLLGTATMVEKLFPMGLSFLNRAFPYLFPNITNMFLKGTAKEFMFDGIFINCSYVVGPAMPVCNGIRNRLPATIVPIPDTKDFKFSFFKHKNETVEGPFKIYGGNKDVFKLGQVIEYQSSNNLSMWDQNTTCNIIRGTDSSIFPPVADYKKDIFIFIPDMCLSLSAAYINKTAVDDIGVYRYENSQTNFADYEKVPENICRCEKNEVKTEPPLCLKTGAIDASNCQGAPVIFSQPHFLDADEEYKNFVQGLHPNPDKHRTFVLIEPKTGVPVIGRKRMQMNMFLKPIEDITLLANVSQGLFPISWVEEGGAINEESMQKLSEMYAIYHTLEIAKWIIIGFGGVILLISLVMYAKYKMLFGFDDNRVSEFSYGVNSFQVASKIEQEPPKPSSVFSITQPANDVLHTISAKLHSDNDIVPS